MQIIEINEPGNDKIENDIAIGIDFGTTNSLIAISINGKPKIIPSHIGEELLASIACFDDISISSIKRLFGKSRAEIESSQALLNITCNMLNQNSATNNELVKLNINNQLLSPVEIGAKIFTNLKQIAEKYLDKPIRKAVITIPAYFNDIAKGNVLLAAKLAGFEPIRLLTEPTAAAYAYGIHKKVQGSYLVYDLGGGTFDVSLLNITQGVIKVIALGGNNMLGGDDIDLLLTDFIKTKYQLVIDNLELADLVKEIKKRLSYELEVRSSCNYDDVQEIIINRQEFENLIVPLVESTIKIVKDVIRQGAQEDIEGIILVGGSSRIPLISKLLKQNFNIEILSDIDPDKIVALGAALQAENLTSNNNMLLIDALPLSLGLELYGGLVEKIILRNSALPISVTKQYTTYVDNQNAIEFHIVQGEREFAKDCKSLSHFTLNNLPLVRAGGVKIEVTFAVDVDGLLSVSALDLLTGNAHTIEMRPSYGLNNQEIDLMLHAAYKNAVIDHQNMLLHQKIIEAESLVKHFNNILSIMTQPEELDEKTQITNTISLLQGSITIKDISLISEHIEELKKISHRLINRRLHDQIATALKGKNINKI